MYFRKSQPEEHGADAYLEGFEVVDEDIWHPEVVDEVEIDGVQLLHVHRAEMECDANEE